ncbi:MAG: hypothetical protein KDK05_06560 [Candidatus Competibacteraceae bacterium]|nr:hypothetical protein [Candidatus Competibacteraceae bacterium]
MKIEAFNLFPTPVFQVPLPQMRPFHDDILTLFQGKIDSGEIQPHQHGYGYQTPTTLFMPQFYPQKYFIEVLGKGFAEACENILYQHTRVDSGSQDGYAWMNTLTIGWANITTRETWDMEPPWHTHLPATLSGCYYVSTASRKGEGNLQFSSPMADTLFQPQTIEIVPKAGHMIIFPSYLKHRPSRCPNTEQIRISLCMDSHWTIQLPHQLPPNMRSNVRSRRPKQAQRR